MNVLVIFSLNFLFVPDCLAQQSATEYDFQRLTESLLRNYNLNIRPIANQSAAVNVSLDFNLVSINDVDDVLQLIYVMVTTVVYWKDKNLVWDPLEFGGLDQMYFGPDKIWTPRIYFMNSHDKEEALFDHPTHHVVTSDGLVEYSSIAKLSCSCRLDLVLFPSDTQTCEFTFAVFDASSRTVNLVVDIDAANSTPIKFTEHGEWKVLGMQVSSEHEERNLQAYVSASASVTIRRRPHYYYLNIHTPVFCIAILCILTFFVPVDSGERLAYALSMHLSLSVYISYVGDILPMASLGMPNVFYTLSAVYFSSTLCLATSALNMALRWSHVRTNRQGDKKIKVLCFSFYLVRKRSSDKSVMDRTENIVRFARATSTNFLRRDSVRPPNDGNGKRESKLFMVFPTGELLNQSTVEDQDENNDEFIKAEEQGNSKTDQSSQLKTPDPFDQKSSGLVDPDLIRFCNTLDYCGFIIITTFIAVIIIMTALNRRWF